MGFFDHDDGRDCREQVYNYDGPIQDEHKAKFSHEVIAGAAGFEAMKAYEDHLRDRGEPVSHPMMKELLAGFASAEVDKLFETKGLDYIDKEKTKHHARQQAEQYAEQRYGDGNTGYEYAQQYQQQGYQQNYQQGYQQQNYQQQNYQQNY